MKERHLKHKNDDRDYDDDAGQGGGLHSANKNNSHLKSAADRDPLAGPASTSKPILNKTPLNPKADDKKPGDSKPADFGKPDPKHSLMNDSLTGLKNSALKDPPKDRPKEPPKELPKDPSKDLSKIGVSGMSGDSNKPKPQKLVPVKDDLHLDFEDDAKVDPPGGKGPALNSKPNLPLRKPPADASATKPVQPLANNSAVKPPTISKPPPMREELKLDDDNEDFEF